LNLVRWVRNVVRNPAKWLLWTLRVSGRFSASLMGCV
jgi:hypothetical protein